MWGRVGYKKTHLQVDFIVWPKCAVNFMECYIVVGQGMQQFGNNRHLVLIRILMIVTHCEILLLCVCEFVCDLLVAVTGDEGWWRFFRPSSGSDWCCEGWWCFFRPYGCWCGVLAVR